MRQARRALAGISGAGVIATGLIITASPAASADPVVNGIYAIPEVGSDNQIARGPNNNMWITSEQAGVDYFKVTPNGTVTAYDAPAVVSPKGIAAGSDGRIWVVQMGGVASFDPATPNNASATAIADIMDPRGMTTGPNNTVWTASGDKVIKVPVANPAGFTSFGATGVTGARGITRTGNTIWVADFGGQQVVSVTGAGVGTEYATGGGPQGIAGGPGDQVAYANPGTNPQTVGRITLGGAPQTKNFPMADPFGVTYASDSAYWIANFAADTLTRMTRTGQSTTLGGFPNGSGPRQIAAGPNNTLWVTLDNTNQLARVTGVVAPPTNVDTTITKKPKKVIKTAKKKATVRFKFTSSVNPATFECKMQRKGAAKKSYKACTTPKKYKLRKGKYTFRVRATANGVTDTSPAKRVFKVKRK